MQNTRTLEGRAALVFGGGSVGGETNNGLATALAFMRAGAHVVIADNNRDALDGAQQRFASLGVDPSSTRAEFVHADVTDEDSVREAVAEATGLFGGIDILHNNVGIARMGGPMEMSLEEWNHVVAVNMTSAFLTCKYVLPHMLAKGSGVVINVASIGGMRYIGYNYPSYSATKAALIGFTQNIALEYADRGIRVNAIAPGYIKTPMIFKQISGAYASADDMVAARDALSPTGQMGQPEDVASAAVFLASDSSRYINGMCLPVDGGLIQRATQPVAQHM